MSATKTGVIVELTEKDSGFLKCTGVTENLFFHADHLLEADFKALKLGDTLSFTVMETNKGPYAIDIHLAKSK